MTIAPKCCRVNVAQLLSRSIVDVPIIILAAKGVWGFISVRIAHSPVVRSAHCIRPQTYLNNQCILFHDSLCILLNKSLAQILI